MPESRSGKKKHDNRKRNKSGHPGYAAGTTDLDDGLVDRLFDGLAPAQYLSLGLAVWYLHSSPMRHRNQCLIASIVVVECARRFGAQADLLGATIEIPWAKDGLGVRYGGLPAIRGSLVQGHVVATVDGRLIDTTASQFPEIRSIQRGLPVAGSLAPDPDVALNVPTTLLAAIGSPLKPLKYDLTPPATVQAVEAIARRTDGVAISRLVNNTLVGYTVMVAERVRMGLLDIDALPAGFRQHVEPVIGHDLVNEGGVLSARPR